MLVACGLLIPFVMFTLQNHSMEKMTAVCLLPIVAAEVAAVISVGPKTRGPLMMVASPMEDIDRMPTISPRIGEEQISIVQRRKR